MKNRLTIMVIIRSSIVWILLVIFAIIYNLATPVVVKFVGKQKCRKLFQTFSYLYVFLVKYICGVNYRIYGMENMLNKSVIIASNHQSIWETQAYNMLFPNIIWILKQELLNIPLFGWALRILSPIAIDRKNGVKALDQILVQGSQAVKNGFSIVVFPEGTRVYPGQVKPFKKGAASIAKALNLPIIPIAQNAGTLVPKGKPWMLPGMVTVKIGAPIYLHDNESIDELTMHLESIIQAMLVEINNV